MLKRNRGHDPATLEIVPNWFLTDVDAMFTAIRELATRSIGYEVLDMGIMDSGGGIVPSKIGILEFAGMSGLVKMNDDDIPVFSEQRQRTRRPPRA